MVLTPLDRWIGGKKNIIRNKIKNWNSSRRFRNYRKQIVPVNKGLNVQPPFVIINPYLLFSFFHLEDSVLTGDGLPELILCTVYSGIEGLQM